MTLGQQQRIFTRLVAQLILYAYEQDYELTFGEALRDPRIAELNAQKGSGISNSLHLDKLAIDLNLFKAGEWLQGSMDHAILGVYWKQLHPLCRWGGDFKPKPDGNHYSMEWDGRK